MTDDGAETDLDLGHYERVTHAPLSRDNNLTTGRIYEPDHSEGTARRLSLGKTVPGDSARHDGIKNAMRKVSHSNGQRLTLVEMGGTVGESNRFPSSRQFARCGRIGARYGVCPPHAGAMDCGRAGVEDEADAALGEGIALDRYSADVLLCAATAT